MASGNSELTNQVHNKCEQHDLKEAATRTLVYRRSTETGRQGAALLHVSWDLNFGDLSVHQSDVPEAQESAPGIGFCVINKFYT